MKLSATEKIINRLIRAGGKCAKVCCAFPYDNHHRAAGAVRSWNAASKAWNDLLNKAKS